jgi:Lon protease-like protein
LSVPELGLFPLGVVLLPTERLPLHIFEPRYRELIGECLVEEREFGLLLGDRDGLREIGTRAAIVEVVDEFPDGRLNIVIEGRDRFRLLELTEGRTFATGEVEPLADEASVSEREQREALLELYREVAELLEAEVGEPDPESGVLSFEIAARVDFGVERKQELLELTSESERLTRIVGLLQRAIEGVKAERELAERASMNGRGVSRHS